MHGFTPSLFQQHHQEQQQQQNSVVYIVLGLFNNISKTNENSGIHWTNNVKSFDVFRLSLFLDDKISSLKNFVFL